jgi:hypothetical protein
MCIGLVEGEQSHFHLIALIRGLMFKKSLLQVHSKDFPVMGSLARDYLACAASSASVEQTFSAAARVCASGRSGLAI